MRLLLYSMLIAFSTNFTYSQSNDNLNLIIAINSSKYEFVGIIYKPYQPAYSPDFNSMRDMLRRKTEQYQHGLNIVVTEIKKGEALKLINKYNNDILSEYQSKLKKASDSFSGWDYSLPQNVNKALEFITWIYTVKSVRDEINLLQLVNNEILRLKAKDPDNFFRSKRFDEMKLVLSKIKDCDTDKFEDLKMEFGLF